MGIFAILLKESVKSTRKEKIEAVGGTLSLIAGLSIFIIQDQGWARVPPTNLDPVLKSVLVSVVGFLITIWTSLVAARDRYDERLVDLIKNIKSILPVDSNVKRTGKIQDTHIEIGEAIRGAREVLNTCVIYISDDDSYLDKMIKSSEKLIEDVSSSVNGGCIWKELISDDAEERAKNIMRKLTNESNHRFACRKVKFKQPIINFIILDPKNTTSKKTIYFGFGMHDGNENGYIYATTDGYIINTFESYFYLLFSGILSDRVSI